MEGDKRQVAINFFTAAREVSLPISLSDSSSFPRIASGGAAALAVAVAVAVQEIRNLRSHHMVLSFKLKCCMFKFMITDYRVSFIQGHILYNVHFSVFASTMSLQCSK